MNHYFTKKMKKTAVISFGIIVLIISFNHIPRKANMEMPEQCTVPIQTSETEEIRHYSDLSADVCQMCGRGRGTLLSVYRGQENLGIISLNTFTLSYVAINPYDDYGKPMKRPAQGSSTHLLSSGKDGYISLISENQWRGYARGSITFNQDKSLNIGKAAKFLCNDCFTDIMDECWTDDPFGVGVIDFKTGDIRLFEEEITAFMFTDYYISCNLREPRDDDSSIEMDFLFFYCPERYHD